MKFNFEQFSNYLLTLNKVQKKPLLSHKIQKFVGGLGVKERPNTSTWWLWKLGTLDKTSNALLKKI